MSVSSCQTINSYELNNSFDSHDNSNVPSQMTWTEELDQKLINYRKRCHWSLQRIAEKIGAPCTAILAQERYKLLKNKRKCGILWFPQEEALLVELKEQNYSNQEIADRLATLTSNHIKRTPDSVQIHYKLMARKNPSIKYKKKILKYSLNSKNDKNKSTCNQIAKKIDAPCKELLGKELLGKELLAKEQITLWKSSSKNYIKWAPQEEALLVELKRQNSSNEEITERLAAVNSKKGKRTIQAILAHYKYLVRKNPVVCKYRLSLKIDENKSTSTDTTRLRTITPLPTTQDEAIQSDFDWQRFLNPEIL